MSGCGTCTLCCKLMGVDEFNKPMDQWCQHCNKTQGCTIYETRPKSCREYECLWLQSQSRAGAELPIELRPDHCHALINPTEQDGFAVHVDPAYPNAWEKGPMGRLVKAMIQKFDVIVIWGDKRRAFLGGRERPILKQSNDGVRTEVIVDDGSGS